MEPMDIAAHRPGPVCRSSATNTTQTAGRPRSRGKSRHRGQWVLADSAGGLLAIGSDLYPSISVATGLDFVGRRLLMPMIKMAISGGESRRATGTADGEAWTARVTALSSSLVPVPIAVLAHYDLHGQPEPTPPTVGLWEWDYEAAHGADPLRVRMRLTNAPSPAPSFDQYPWPAWIDETVAAPDVLRMTAALDRLRQPGEPPQHLDISAAPHGRSPRRLRVTGRRIEYGGRSILAGTSLLRPPEPTVQHSHLAALLSLSRDGLCVIDPETEVIYLSSPVLAKLGIALPASRAVSDACHPEDLNAIRMLLRRSADRLAEGEAHVRLRTSDGWRVFEVATAHVEFESGARHVWCRVRPSP